jgi:hypothetical protein
MRLPAPAGLLPTFQSSDLVCWHSHDQMPDRTGGFLRLQQLNFQSYKASIKASQSWPPRTINKETAQPSILPYLLIVNFLKTLASF